MNRKTLTLLPKVGRRVERGHAWVFSNEVAEVTGSPAPGDEVVVRSAKGHFLGMGLFSLSSLIRARIYSRVLDQPCDVDWLRRQLAAALAYRKLVFEGLLPSSFRLAHGDGDCLPGLVVDVFGRAGHPPALVLQFTTAGMDRRRAEIITILKELLQPAVIVERSDLAVRELEGLAPRKELLEGELIIPWPVRENGVTIYADLLEGQKTGYFLDQAANRAWVAPFVRGARVADLFCYVGAWSILAAHAGAREAVGIDSSARALEWARKSADELPENLVRPRFEEADAFQWLRKAAAEEREYEVVIVDPPALAKSKKDLTQAMEAYRELNLRALQLLPPGGLLVTCSCSHHVAKSDFREMLILAARDAARGRAKGAEFTLEREMDQNVDHPVALATPETSYLKCAGVRRRV